MGDGIRTGLGRDLDKSLGNKRTGDGRAEEIETFVNGVGAEHRENEIANELFADILNVDVFRLDPEKLRLLACGLKLFALAEIGGECHHFAAVFGLEPLEDDRRIKAAGIGEDNFLGRGHGLPFRG